MSNLSKNMVLGSMVVSGLVAAVAIADFVTGIPFGKQIVLDITLLLGAVGSGYLCFDSWKDLP